ncbi:MAG: prepilin-type N-terminal cleavage/methylation domain-containing protein [Gammaproteobacteria bacterium]|nr:prepilin-type N-terminal cleavage/methylation domain-containing protein [Gammaproteobacteria bacterium]
MRINARRQAGLSIIEVLVATVLLSIALVPMLDAIQTGVTGSGMHQSAVTDQYHLLQRAEEILAQPFAVLKAEAASLNNKNTPTSYSDSAGSERRRLVYLSFYDFGNTDGDSNPFTIMDPDIDGDGNPYTGHEVKIHSLWLRVEIEGTSMAMETMTGMRH